MNKLEQAVSCLTDSNELTVKLARILDIASQRGKTNYEQVEAIAGNDTEDVLFTAWQWRLLIPVRTFRCGEWDDRLLLMAPGEQYEMPNISRLIVKDAQRFGDWDADKAITAFFEAAGEPLWRLIPSLVRRIKEGCPVQGINAKQIKVACREMGFGEQIDGIIAILKGAGIISPKLGSLAHLSRTQIPLYEINPVLFVKSRSGVMDVVV